MIFLGLKYEPLSDPPVIKICEWGPWEPREVLPYIDYTGMCRCPGYGFQAFKFRTVYTNQENNVGNRVYKYIKLINSLIQVAINFLERRMDTY